jgi:hypothetical protein
MSVRTNVVMIMTTGWFFTDANAQVQLGSMRRFAEAQLAADVGVLGRTVKRGSFDSYAVERAKILDSLEVWRVSPPTDHSRQFLFAVVNGTILRLGGFAAPELFDVAPLLSLQPLDHNQADRLGNQLAMLADPHGALRTIFPSTTGPAALLVLSKWKSLRPRDWPHELVEAMIRRGCR